MRWRNIHIGQDEYLYHIGKGNVVIRKNNFKLTVRIEKIKELTPEAFERGQWKRTRDGMVTPHEIKDYLTGVLEAGKV